MPATDNENVGTMLRSDLVSIIDSKMADLKTSFADMIKNLKSEITAEMDKKIENLECKVSAIEKKVTDEKFGKLEKDVEKLKKLNYTLERQVESAIDAANNVEQYGRRWLLRLHGVQQSEAEEEEDCTQKCLDIFQTKLGVSLQKQDIEAAHRLRPRTDGKPPTVIIRFTRRDQRQRVLSNRRKLKSSGVSIAEDLTALNMKLLNRVQNNEGVEHAWTSNGKVLGNPVGSKQRVTFSLFTPTEDSIQKALANENRRNLRPRPSVVA